MTPDELPRIAYLGMGTEMPDMLIMEMDARHDLYHIIMKVGK
jgi:hypothetical protein